MDKIDVMFTGHRPSPKLGGWNEDNIIAQKVKKWLSEEVRFLMLGPDGARTFVSGGALGTDQWAAEAVIDNMGLYPDIKLVLAIPCDNYHSTWPKESQERFFRIQEKATETIIVSPGGYESHKNFVRDQWMVDRSRFCIAVYDGSKKGGTHHTIQLAKKKGIPIERLDPRLITTPVGSKVCMSEDDVLGRWKKDEIGTILENDSLKYDCKVQFEGTTNADLGFAKIENAPKIFYFYYRDLHLT